ncbi:MAG: type II secretion system F family protein [Puniceicoccales bacterium]|jgi:type IV pilus assembly protein PilC|nr:type II secretion system F family protein [Puniceicoccales bacterium]
MEPIKKFSYFGRGVGGGYESGEIAATDVRTAQKILIGRRIAVEFLEEKRPPFWKRELRVRGMGPSLSPVKLVSFTRQLAILLRAGVHLVDALKALGSPREKPSFLKILESLIGEVRLGRYLHEAMGLYPKIFDEPYRQLVRAGELSGNLAAVLGELALHRGRSLKVRNRTISALIYPVIVLATALAAILFLAVKVIPRFQILFQVGGERPPLPLLSRSLMALCHFLEHRLFWVLSLFLVLLLLYVCWSRSVRGRQLLGAVALAFPLLGPLVVRQNLVLFLRTFGLVIGNGIPFGEAVQLACQSIPNVALRHRLDAIAARAREGVSLGELFSGERYIPATVQGLVSVGEKGANLSAMLSLAADVLEEELETALERLAAVLQPALVLLLAGVVATVAAAFFLPIAQLLQLQTL